MAAWIRSACGRKAKPLPVECVVRGYLAGGGFKEYQKTGAILDHALPAGLLDGSKLPTPIFTPSARISSTVSLIVPSTEPSATTMVSASSQRYGRTSPPESRPKICRNSAAMSAWKLA